MALVELVAVERLAACQGQGLTKGCRRAGQAADQDLAHAVGPRKCNRFKRHRPAQKIYGLINGWPSSGGWLRIARLGKCRHRASERQHRPDAQTKGSRQPGTAAR